MAANWLRVPVVEICEVHVDCVNRTAPIVTHPTPYKMIRTTNVRDGFIDVDNVRYVTRPTYDKWTRRLIPKRNDVILTREAPLGDVGKLRSDDNIFLGQRLYHFRVAPEKADADFLLYGLLSPDLQRQIHSFGSGSTVSHMRLEDIPELKIDLPPLEAQKRIGGALAAYDDLIENNQRRIRILEEIARNLYREWFVHFRFPGHENNSLVQSSIGEIPKGWAVRPIESLISFQIGGGWGKEVEEDGYTDPAWVIRGTDIPNAKASDTASVPHRYHTSSNLRSRKLAPCDIVFEVSGGSKGQPVGRTLYITHDLLSSFNGEDVMCASFCKRIKPAADSYRSELLYLSFLEGYESGEIEQYQVQSTGISNFKWTEYIANTQRVVPSEPVQQAFQDVVGPMLTQIAKLGLQAVNLRRTRDLLIPRLLSGQLKLEAN